MKQLMQEILRSAVFGSAITKPPAGSKVAQTGPSAGGAGVSVVISSFNEEQNMHRIIPDLPMEAIDEVILVDGRSADDVVRFARKLLPEIEIVTEEKGGNGAAVRYGYASSTGEILVFLEAESIHDPREIDRFVTLIRERAGWADGG
jgi:glycosyltransferase involved in cell wall biosynthesis